MGDYPKAGAHAGAAVSCRAGQSLAATFWPVTTLTIRERLQTLNLDGLSKILMSSKAIDLKFREAVPENLLASIVNDRALDRESAERVSTQPINASAMNDSQTEERGSLNSGQASS